MVHIEATQEVNAPPRVVWELLSDARGWQRWAPMDETALERPGATEPDGVGAIRRFRTGNIVSREEVLVAEAPRHLAYTLLSGMPLLDYRADVTLEAAGTGTIVRWKAAFRPKYWGTGWMYALGLRRFLGKLLAALAKAAAEAGGKAPSAGLAEAGSAA